MVRVSVSPSLTEGLGHSQVTPRQMLAVDGCKMLLLKPSHCIIPIGKRNGTFVSYYQFYKLARKLFLIFRNTVTVDHSANPFLLLYIYINFYSFHSFLAFLPQNLTKKKIQKKNPKKIFCFYLHFLEALIIKYSFKRTLPLMDKLRSGIFSFTLARHLCSHKNYELVITFQK